MVTKMDIKKHLLDSAKESRDEIENAITNAKRSTREKQFRRRFYQEMGRFGKWMEKHPWYAETVSVKKDAKRNKRFRGRWPGKSYGRKTRRNTFYIQKKGGEEHDKHFNQNADP